MPVTDNGHPIRQLLGNVKLVSREEDGDPVMDELPDHLLDTFTGLVVETQGRFVQQQHRRTVHECLAERHLLLHAAREGLDRVVGASEKVYPVEEVRRPLSRQTTGDAPHRGPVEQILHDRQAPVQVPAALQHGPDAGRHPIVMGRE